MKIILSESGFARINRILQGNVSNIDTYAILTGENPCGCELSNSENREMNNRMETIIREKGYGFHKIGGNFFENEEHSVIVPNMNREDAIQLGKILKQYSVIFGTKHVTSKGRVFMKHQMLRTYCDVGCEKYRNWDILSLDSKLKGLKPLPKKELGYVESERNVSLTDEDIQSKTTNYSYVGDDKRRFSIPFYDDPKASSYPSHEYGKTIIPYKYDMTKQRELSTKEKFAFMDSEVYYDEIEESYNPTKKLIRKILKEETNNKFIDKVMNTKYERYIEYIVNDLKPPYFNNMRDQYGLSEDEYEMVLSKVFNQIVSIVDSSYSLGNIVFNKDGNEIYFENSGGYWQKWEYDNQGNKIYFENSDGTVVDNR